MSAPPAPDRGALHRPIDISPRASSWIVAVICFVVIVMIAFDTYGHLSATREEVEGPITRCMEYRRGLTHSLSVYLETLGADARYGIGGPPAAMATVQDLCERRATVKIVAYDTMTTFGRVHRLAAIRARDSRYGFDEDEYASERAPSLLTRGIGALVLAAIAAAAIWTARRRADERD